MHSTPLLVLMSTIQFPLNERTALAHKTIEVYPDALLLNGGVIGSTPLHYLLRFRPILATAQISLFKRYLRSVRKQYTFVTTVECCLSKSLVNTHVQFGPCFLLSNIQAHPESIYATMPNGTVSLILRITCPPIAESCEGFNELENKLSSLLSVLQSLVLLGLFLPSLLRCRSLRLVPLLHSCRPKLRLCQSLPNVSAAATRSSSPSVPPHSARRVTRPSQTAAVASVELEICTVCLEDMREYEAAYALDCCSHKFRCKCVEQRMRARRAKRESRVSF